MELTELNLHVWRGDSAKLARAAIPTGFAELDERLPGGGWPRGALTEIFVDRYGIGELTVLIPALAALTKPAVAETEKWIAWIAPPFIPYAPALKQRGVSIDRLLMIHPSSGKDRLWAVEQVVRSGSSSGVLAWLAQASDVVLRRLQLAAEERDCWVVLFRPIEALRNRSPAALRIRLVQQGREPAPAFAALRPSMAVAAAVRVEIVKCRGGRPGVVDIVTSSSSFDRDAYVAEHAGSREPASGATPDLGETG
jgi:protein ImuA